MKLTQRWLMKNQIQVCLPPDHWLLLALTAAEVLGVTRHRRVTSHLCDNRNDISKKDNNSCNLLSPPCVGSCLLMEPAPRWT